MTREEFTTHVERGRNALRRFLVALCCGDTSLADDIAQEAYIKAYLSSDGLSDPKKFDAWLMKIAHNTFLSNRRASRPAGSYDEALHVASAESSDAGFRYEALYAALAKIPAKERTAILLFYIEDYSINDISAIVNASPEAVKQQLSRGRSHLRNLLSGK